MYFSARTEGRISYGHLGRTDSCSCTFVVKPHLRADCLVAKPQVGFYYIQLYSLFIEQQPHKKKQVKQSNNTVLLRLDFDWTCYAALLPRRGRILRRTLSVRLSVCPSVRPSRYRSVTSRHLANYNDTHVLLGTR